MIDRPFLSKKLSELKELAKSNDDKIIKNIFFELSLRKSSASKFFLKELEAKYGGASNNDEEEIPDTNYKKKTNQFTKESILKVSDDVIETFINALEIELEVIRKKQSEQSFILENGKKYDQSGELFYYEFRVDEEIGRIKDDQPITVVFNGKENSAEIVSQENKIIKIASSEDFGKSILSIQIKFDLAYLTEKLKERLEKVKKEEVSFNQDMSEKVLGKNEFESNVEVVNPSGLRELNADQKQILGVSQGCEVSFLWGPPGTGKTHTLSEVIHAFYKHEKRVLLVSNTNSAIDLLIKSLCKGLKKLNDSNFKEGKVLRYKKIADPELESEFGSYVNIDQVVERLSKSLVSERESLTKDKGELEKELNPLYGVIEAFKKVNQKQKNIEDIESQLQQDNQSLLKTKEDANRYNKNLETLNNELLELNNSSFLGKILKRDSSKINEDIYQTNLQIELSSINFSTIKKRINDSKGTLQELKDELNIYVKTIKGHDEEKTKEKIKKFEEDIKPILKRITEINNELSKLADSIKNNSLVIGATAIQTFLRPDDFNNFDVVVIDEASMLRLPDVYYVSGLAKSRVVIAGDFRQIPAIVISKDSGVKKWIGEDIFTKAGIEEKVMNNENPENLVQLNTQYRMQKPIQELVNNIFYNGNLKVGNTKRFNREIHLPDIFEDDLILIDTSKYRPFENFKSKTGSKYNLYNTMVVRNLSLLLNSYNAIESTQDLGIITPYAAQSEILSKTFKELNLTNVECGTVHRFQGNEKNIIIFDIPESIPGERQVQENMSMVTDKGISSEEAKLLNVAVTRARGLIFLVCNMSFLLKNLNKRSILYSFIDDFKRKGSVIDAEKIIASGPEVSYENPDPKINPSDLNSVTYLDEKTFDDIFLSDVSKAKKWIIIYSGFCTYKRLGIYSDIFKEKIKKGVKIRCVVPPANDQSLTMDSAQKCINEMVRMGITVDLVRKIHQKTVFIDEDIVYSGSLNVLSHTGKTGERMFRNVSKTFSDVTSRFEIRNFQLLKGRMHTDYLSDKQNPNCESCGALTVFSPPTKFNSRSGLYLCSEKCGFQIYEDKYIRNILFGKKDFSNDDDKGDNERKPCPIDGCDGNLVLRKGRYGKFYGCSNYFKTKCKGRI